MRDEKSRPLPREAWDNTGDLPPFRQVQREISLQLLHRKYLPGERLPSEAEMVKHFGVSRTTINKAISELARHGLVVRNRRAGTVVSRNFHARFWLPVSDLGSAVRASGEAYSFSCTAREVVPNGTASDAWEAVKPSAKLLRLTVMHFCGDAPMAEEHRLVNLAVCPSIAGETFSATPPSTWLLEHVPWTRAEQRVSACTPNASAARRLKVAPREACLVLERRTWCFGEPVTRARFVYAGTRFDIRGEESLPTL